MATESSLSACAGHLPSGRRWFRKQRTVNPPIGPNGGESPVVSAARRRDARPDDRRGARAAGAPLGGPGRPPRPGRSPAANATSPSTPSGCCWSCWSPPPACKTAMAPGRCCGGCAPPTVASAWSGLTPPTRAGWSAGRRAPWACGRHRPQAPGPRLPGTAPQMGGGAHLRLDQQAPSHRPRLRTPARPPPGHGHLGDDHRHDPPARTPAPSGPHPSTSTHTSSMNKVQKQALSL